MSGTTDTIESLRAQLAAETARADREQALRLRLERALDARLDETLVAVARSFTGCSEDRCPKEAQAAITGLCLHAQGLQGMLDMLRVPDDLRDDVTGGAA